MIPHVVVFPKLSILPPLHDNNEDSSGSWGKFFSPLTALLMTFNPLKTGKLSKNDLVFMSLGTEAYFVIEIE